MVRGYVRTPFMYESQAYYNAGAIPYSVLVDFVTSLLYLPRIATPSLVHPQSLSSIRKNLEDVLPPPT